MALATVDETGLPNVRMVLLKGLDGAAAGAGRGFVFYTNFESAKGREFVGERPGGLAVPLEVVGAARSGSGGRRVLYRTLRRTLILPAALAAVGSGPGPHSSRARLRVVLLWKPRFAKFTAQFHIGDIPRPDYWSGFRVVPTEMEFWHDRPFRLHERVVYRRGDSTQTWQKARLFP